MCGIAGTLSETRRTASDLRQLTSIMTAQLTHRGPDAQGTWVDEGIGLGHRRLSILDLSAAGAQPMHSPCGRYVLVFNGEIYNHLSLRAKLSDEFTTQRWVGRSDTETLLAAIRLWGLDRALSKAHGMFAIALWDKLEKRLSLARDRMGEKPLYWGWAGEDFVFASELKALRVHPGCPDAICRVALSQFLQFLYIPAPRSIHPGLFKLEPGTILDVTTTPLPPAMTEPIRPGQSAGSLCIRRYWNLADTIEKGAGDRADGDEICLTQLEEILEKAVTKQMIADVPLGAFLSGGVDSSTVTALMQKHCAAPVRTYTVGFDIDGFDESCHAEAVASHLGTEHTTIRMSEKDCLEIVPALPSIYDEPFADSSQIPMYLVCKGSKKHVSVALSGDGADELFGGYNRYIWGPSIASKIEAIPIPLQAPAGHAIQSIPANWVDMLGKASRFPNRAEQGVVRLSEKLARIGQCLEAMGDGQGFYESLVTQWPPSSGIVRGSKTPITSQLDDPLPEIGANSLLERMIFQDMRSYLPDDILCKVDRAAMAVSLETRAPFLDPDIINFAARLPEHMKVRNGVGKWALRQILYRHVPSTIVDRPKAGFAVPIGHWLRSSLREWAEDLLEEKRLQDDGFFDPKLVREIWEQHVYKRRDWTARLWPVLMFQAWYKTIHST